MTTDSQEQKEKEKKGSVTTDSQLSPTPFYFEAILARIDNCLTYGMINDVFELAACYACYIAVGYAFNDANKRTAFAAMDICLTINGIELDFDTEDAGKLIIKAAQSIADENELAEWLRILAQ